MTSASGPVAGTRPGLHAQTLISTGQADLDRILGGGLPLGSVLVILEDACTQHHNTLLKYFVAEGVACGHSVHWAVPEGARTSTKLPLLVERSSQSEENALEKDEGGLKIAWQYRRYIKDKQKAPAPKKKTGSAFQRKKAAGTSSSGSGLKDWCHAFDLTRHADQASATPGLEKREYGGDSALSELIRDTASWSENLQNAQPRADSRRQLAPEAQRAQLARPALNRHLAPPSNQTSTSSNTGTEGGDESSLAKPSNFRPVRRLMTSVRPSGVTSSDTADSNQEADLNPGPGAENPSSGTDGGTAPGDSAPSHDSGKASGFRRGPVKGLMKSMQRGTGGLHSSVEASVHAQGSAELSRAANQESSNAENLQEGGIKGLERVTDASSPAAQLSGLSLGREEGVIRDTAHAAPPTHIKTESGSSSVGRLAVQSLGSFKWGVGFESREGEGRVLATVHKIKGLARKLRFAAMISIPAGLYGDDFAMRLLHMADAGILLDNVTDHSSLLQLISDPASCCGTLQVKKLPALNTLSPPVPSTPLYLVRHRRRRITLQAFEVDPDAEAALAQEPSASKPTSALLCGGPLTTDKKAFDF